MKNVDLFAFKDLISNFEKNERVEVRFSSRLDFIIFRIDSSLYKVEYNFEDVSYENMKACLDYVLHDYTVDQFL